MASLFGNGGAFAADRGRFAGIRCRVLHIIRVGLAGRFSCRTKRVMSRPQWDYSILGSVGVGGGSVILGGGIDGSGFYTTTSERLGLGSRFAVQG